MIINQCKARNPETCRYHHPNAGAQAFSTWKAAEKRVKDAEIAVLKEQLKPAIEQDSGVNHAFLTAKYEAEDAEQDYYATSDGLVALALQIDAAETEMDKFTLQRKLDIATYKVQEVERINQMNDEAGGALIPQGSSSFEAPVASRDGSNVYWPETTGSKYRKGAKLTEIKTGIVNDIRKAQKENFLPKHLKFKVTANSSHSRIAVTIIGASDKQLHVDDDSGYGQRYTEEARELLRRVEAIQEAYVHYQYDEIEGRRNYSSFWGHVQFESDWAKRERLQKEREKEVLAQA